MNLTGLFLAEELFPLHVVIVFLFGAMMGSFFNVCIYRLPYGQSVNRPRRSFCPSCGSTLAWYDNIPILSYIALGGLCRHCGARISWRYWAVELLTSLLFVAVFWIHRYTLATPFFLFLTAVLIISTFTDLDHWIIPDSISLGGALVGVLAALLLSAARATGRWPHLGESLFICFPFKTLGPWAVALNSLVGAVFGFLLLWTVGVLGTLAFRKEAMGMGDMKLFAAIGAFVGWQGCLIVLVVASFFGATIGLSLMAAQWIVAKIWPSQSSAADQAASPTAPQPPQPLASDSLPTSASEPLAAPSADQPVAVQPATEPPSHRSSRQLHHLPFGPYIAIGAYVVALFYRPIMDWLMKYVFLFDAFGGQ